MPRFSSSAPWPADKMRLCHLFSRKNATFNAERYFRLWQALAGSLNDPSFPLRLGQRISTESFNPPIFASLCSPNLNVAMERMSHFKRLIGRLTHLVEQTIEGNSAHRPYHDNLFFLTYTLFVFQNSGRRHSKRLAVYITEMSHELKILSPQPPGIRVHF